MATFHPRQTWLDFGSAEALSEARQYHPDDGWGFFSILQRLADDTYPTPWGDQALPGKYRPMRQNSYPLYLLPSVIDGLDPQMDSYISQAEFTKPNRRSVNLWRLGVSFADLDTYNTGWREYPPESIRDAVLMACDTYLDIPRPSTILGSGRGLYLKWFHEGLPRAALPRWAALERHLVRLFADFGADLKAKDASRVLRIVGTRNSKADRVVQVLHIEPGEDGQPKRYSFDYLAESIFPFTREEIAQQRIEREAKRAERRRQWEERLRKGTEGNLRRLSPAQLNWDRLNDLQKLAELRQSANGGRIPDGQRQPLLFWQLDFMLLSGVIEPDQLWYEAQALANNLGLTDYQQGELSTLYTKAKAHRAGHKVEFNGRQLSPLYTPRNQTLIDLLGITPDEEGQMQTIISQGEAKRRDRERKAAQSADNYTGQGVRASNEEKREQALAMRDAGASVREIAKALDIGVRTAWRWSQR